MHIFILNICVDIYMSYRWSAFIYIYTICVCVYSYKNTWIYTQGVVNLFSKTLMPWLAWLGRSHNALAIVIAQAAGDAARCPILAASAVQFWTTRLQFRRRISSRKIQGSSKIKEKKKPLTPTNIVFCRLLEIPQKKELHGFKLSSEILYSRVFVTLSDPSEWVIDLVCMYIYNLFG